MMMLMSVITPSLLLLYSFPRILYQMSSLKSFPLSVPGDTKEKMKGRVLNSWVLLSHQRALAERVPVNMFIKCYLLGFPVFLHVSSSAFN